MKIAMHLPSPHAEPLVAQTAAPAVGAAVSHAPATSPVDLPIAREMLASIGRSPANWIKEAAKHQVIWPAFLAILGAAFWALSKLDGGANLDAFVGSFPWIVIWFMLCAYSVPLGIATMSVRRSSSRAQRAIDTVVSAHEHEDIGLLVIATQIAWEPVRRKATAALLDILPHVTEADGHNLTHDQRSYLIQLLRMDTKLLRYKNAVAALGTRSGDKFGNQRATDLRLAIVKAHKAIGGAQELQIVLRLSDASYPTTPERTMLMEAACEALPFVEARASRAATGDTLLRASEDRGASLLRAAHATDDTPADQLLRPRL